MTHRATLRLLLALLSLVVGALLWDWIRLPYRNPQDIVGVLSVARFDPLNNLLRYGLFVSLPALTWWTIGRTFKRTELEVPTATNSFSTWPWALPLLLGLGLLIAAGTSLEGLASRLANGQLDPFHDGDYLAPAFNGSFHGRLWTANVLTRGALHDALLPQLGWRLFGIKSIGAFKAVLYLVEGLVPFGLWGLVFCLQNSLRGVADKLERTVLVALMFTVLQVAQPEVAWFQIRTLPMMLTLSVLVIAFKNDSRIAFFAAGTTALLALLVSSDAGVYIIVSGTAAIGASWVFLRRLEDPQRDLVPWTLGLVSGVTCVALALGLDELLAWFSQIVSSASRWDWIYAYVYPSPLSRDSWPSYAVPLVLIALLPLSLVARLSSYRRNHHLRPLGEVHLTLTLLALLAFRTALGRSDPSHLAQGFSFVLIATVFSVWLALRPLPARLLKAALVLAALPLAGTLAVQTHRGDLLAAPRISTAVGAYASRSDASFLTESQHALREALAPLVAQQDCFFTFPNEPAWYYLLRKPSCSPYFFTAHASGRDEEHDLIESLQREEPHFILYASADPRSVIDGISNSRRLPAVDAWIRDHYAPSVDIDGNSIWEFKTARTQD